MEPLEARLMLSATLPALDSIPVVLDAGGGRVMLLYRGAGAPGTALMRLAADGRADPTFGGGDGVVEIANVGPGQAVLQPDGNLLILSRSPSGPAICRLNGDGSVDQSFGDGGQVRLRDRLQSASRIFLQDDGRIVAAGLTETPIDKWDYDSTLAVARYTASGRPDATFGTAGVATTPLPEPAFGIGITSIRAFADGAVGVAIERWAGDGDTEVRYAPDGRGAPAIATFPNEVYQALPDGTALTIDSIGYDDLDVTFALRRYGKDGAPLASFNAGEPVTFVSDWNNADLYPVVAPDGRVILPIFPGDGDLGVLAFKPDGTPDTAYGPGGRLAIQRDPHSIAGDDFDMIATEDGGLIAVHFTQNVPNADPTSPFPTGLTVSRVGPDGRVVRGFGMDGQITFAFDAGPIDAPPDNGGEDGGSVPDGDEGEDDEPSNDAAVVLRHEGDWPFATDSANGDDEFDVLDQTPERRLFGQNRDELFA
jgi:uncharacterized delta-60 repeat protein